MPSTAVQHDCATMCAAELAAAAGLAHTRHGQRRLTGIDRAGGGGVEVASDLRGELRDVLLAPGLQHRLRGAGGAGRGGQHGVVSQQAASVGTAADPTYACKTWPSPACRQSVGTWRTWPSLSAQDIAQSQLAGKLGSAVPSARSKQKQQQTRGQFPGQRTEPSCSENMPIWPSKKSVRVATK